MDFFERAHTPRKSSSKMENKADEAVKRQLKQMMHAYKKGNNQGILKSSEFKPKYDIDEILSVSDFSEFSMARDADNTMDTTISHTSDDLQSTSNENNSSKYNTDENTQDDSLEDVIECSEEVKAFSASSVDVSESTSFGNSSAVFESSDSNDSELSIPSSLQISSGSGTDSSNDAEFDADGTLASKILQNLNKKDHISKKRKIPRDQAEIEIRKIDNKIKQKLIEEKPKKKNKNSKPETHNSTEYFLEEDFSSDTESGKRNQSLQELKTELILNETKSKKKPSQKAQQIDLSDNSINSDSLDSVTTSNSAPFISVSAEDMSSQSLDELLGDYIHPTIRNLSMDHLNITPIRTSSSMFPADTMKVKDIIDDEISSLIPEVDEELAIEDLNLDTDTQELIEESNSFNDMISTEVMSPIEDMITETTPSDDTIVDEVSMEEGIIPMKLYNGNNQFVLVMKHPAELHIHGKVQIADINGMTEIFGYKLNYDSVDVYAPYSHFAQCLKTLENPHEVNPDLHSELTLAGLSVPDANEVVSNIEENSAVIILSKLNSCKLNFVENNFNADLFSKRCDNTPRFLKSAAESLGCSFYLKPPKRSFEEKAIWDDIYSNAERNGSRGIICGGKGTGKSTFLRHYVNSLLGDGPVLVIDLDPGQAEFTVPGSISATIVDRPLIGPNFTHLKTPEKMLNIGIINTMDNAKRYLSAVSELVTFCRANEDFRELPWIVNTMGLCNHMGLKFMTYIILQIKPTFLYQIDSKVPKKRFEVELDHLTVIHLYEEYSNDRSFRNVENPYDMEYSFVIARHQDNAPVKGNTIGSSLQPRDERYLNILAYFGELLNNRSQGLLEIIPYQVSMKDLNIGLNVKIPGDSVTKVINGKIVALCQQKELDKGKVFTLGDKALLCLGHGLIRSIDYEQGILYVLTPTPIGKLNLVDTLVYSDWMPELRGQERELPSGTSIPYRTANTPLHHRKLMFPPRRRFNPLQLLKMSRNS